MVKYECERCGDVVTGQFDYDTYMPPSGWLILLRSVDAGGDPERSEHFCTPNCLIGHLQENGDQY